MKVITCPHCNMKYRIDPAKFTQPELRIRCKSCSEVFTVDLRPDQSVPAQPPAQVAPPPPAAAPATPPPAAASTPATRSSEATALIGHDNQELREMMTALLSEAGFRVHTVDNGIDALMYIEQHRPAVAVLDVALPKMFGFEVAEVVRRDPELNHVRILLIAAIYDKTKYKRSPASLYGADDYIEKHHIPDSLVDKCQRLVQERGTPGMREEETSRIVPPEEAQREEAQREAIRQAEMRSDLSEEDLARASRLARTIVSDIALYNQEAIEKGVREGNLRDLLKNEFAEGRQLLEARLPDHIGDVTPFLEMAIDSLIASKRKEYGLDG